MKRLATLDDHNYTDNMTVYERYNVRAVIRRGSLLAMERSRLGEYKFPGGGADPGESCIDALQREIREELGLILLPESVLPIGEILEARKDLFCSTQKYLCHSYYYFCDVAEETVEPEWTESERNQGCELVWVTSEEVFRANQLFLHKKWIYRDTLFLRILIGQQRPIPLERQAVYGAT